MRLLNRIAVVTGGVIVIGALGYQWMLGIAQSENGPYLNRPVGTKQIVLGLTTLAGRPSATARYRIDPKRSDLMVRAFSGGLLWFKGHDHFVRPSDFSGEVELTPGAITPATLLLTIRAASVEETRPIFTPPQKKIINKESLTR
jgi:hypothetical protein